MRLATAEAEPAQSPMISRYWLAEQVVALRDFSEVPDQKYAYSQVLDLLLGGASED